MTQRPRQPLRMLAALVAAALLAGGWAGAGEGGTAFAAAKPRPRAAHAAPVPKLIFGASLLRAPAVAVTMAPAGISVEYPVMATDMGAGPCPPPSLAAELTRLGSPPLELAGVSQDETAPPGTLPQPPTSWQAATLYPLPAGFWTQLHCLLSSTREQLTVGLNMRTGSLAWATQMAGEARAAAVNGLSFSLGNEPDLYELPNYGSLDKPFAGEEAAAAGLYEQLAAYLEPAVAGEALLGPELAAPTRWRRALPLVVRAVGLGTVGVHLYPLTACGSGSEATIAGLLSRSAGSSPGRLAWVARTAHGLGVPAIISEANSASCGGQPGVSNTPAAAVWGLRFGISALEAGFGEVRFHSSGNSYDPFVVRGGRVYPRPLADALVALNSWFPLGTTLHPVPSTSLAAAGVVAHAALRPDGTVVLILDDQSARPAKVLLRGVSLAQLTTVSPLRAGMPTRTVTSPTAQLHLAIAPNEIVAVAGRP
ncbi:MAG TPA: hypothetical protein VMB91_11620 [Solirubrobacteraceae bacterium]|nr:hypothetical protein [Solirubrobacteraceae bacterium]